MIDIIPFLILFSFISLEKEDEINHYREAVYLILSSKEYQNLKPNKKFYVSSEVSSIYGYAVTLQEEVKPYIDINQSEFYDSSNYFIVNNDELMTLSNARKAKVKIYFSEINEGLFFAEVLKSSKKQIYLKDIPVFGNSYVYMFYVDDGKVKLLYTTIFIYS